MIGIVTLGALNSAVVIIGGVRAISPTSVSLWGWHPPLVVVVTAAVVAPVLLLWRRRSPVLVTALTALAFVLSSTLLPVGFALLTVAVQRRDWVLWACTAGVAAAFWMTDGTADPAVVNVGLSVVLAAFWALWGSYVGARRALLQSLRDRARRAEEEQLVRAEQARQTERARIAREMHDIVAHKVSLIALQAGGLEVNAQLAPERVAGAAAQIRTTAREALEDLRGVLGVLRAGDAVEGGAELLPQPGLEDLGALVDRSRAAGLLVELRWDPAFAARRAGEHGDEDRTSSRPGSAGSLPAASRAAGGADSTPGATASEATAAVGATASGAAGAAGAAIDSTAGSATDAAAPGSAAHLAVASTPSAEAEAADDVATGSAARPVAVPPATSATDAVASSSEGGSAEQGLPRSEDPWSTVPTATGRTAYRLVQEALTNVTKHARGASTTVLLEQRNSDPGPGPVVPGPVLIVSVVNRRPVAAGTLLPGSGAGLIGLRERVELVGGRLTAGPTAEGGWSVRAALPTSSTGSGPSMGEVTGAGRSAETDAGAPTAGRGWRS